MRHIYKLLMLALVALFCVNMRAEQLPISVRFDVRADWEFHHFTDEDTIINESAFAGKYINFMLDGNMSEKWSYHLHYRFNKVTSGSDFFNAIDWAQVNYDINPQWRVSAGKQVVMIGGYEYDKAPIDVYYWSSFWNDVVCYELGVYGQYFTKDGKNSIMLQVCNSPFSSRTLRFENLYAYNFGWYANYGVWNGIWSLNMMEYEQGKYVNYIVLGNQFNVGPVTLELDYMNRYYIGKGPFFNDFSVIGKAAYNIKDRANVFLKGGYDYNNTENNDAFVAAGSRYGYFGAGAEFFPIKDKKNVRLHAYWYTNNNHSFKDNYVAMGVKWALTAFERQ